MRWTRMLRKGLEAAQVPALSLAVLALAGLELGDFAATLSSLGAPDRADEPDLLAGVPLHGLVVPLFPATIRGSKESALGEAASQTTPVKASLWLAPVTTLGGGAGLGWCEMTDVEEPGPSGVDQRREFRVRLAGGMVMPLTPSIGLDLRGGITRPR